MKIVFYPVHQEQSFSDNSLLSKLAKANSSIAIALDIMFYPPCCYEAGRSFQQQFQFTIEFLWAYLKWWIKMLLNGHFVIPSGFICTLVDLGCPFYKQSLIHSSSMREFFQDHSQGGKFIDKEVKNEIMATYIRYTANPGELYGILPFNQSVMNHFILRYKVYCFLLQCLFKLRPICYFTIQRSYLHKFLPCYFAIRAHVPVLMLGSSDQTFIKTSIDHVPLHWDEIDFKQSPLFNLLFIMIFLKEQENYNKKRKQFIKFLVNGGTFFYNNCINSIISNFFLVF